MRFNCGQKLKKLTTYVCVVCYCNWLGQNNNNNYYYMQEIFKHVTLFEVAQTMHFL